MITHEIEQLNKQVIPKNDSFNVPELSTNTSSTPQGTYDRLNQFFSDQNKEQRDIVEARQILGDSAMDLTDGQVQDLVNEVQFLVDSWLDEYEKREFDGKSLNEVIGG